MIENLRVQSRYKDDDRRELEALSNEMETLEDGLSIDDLEGTKEYQRLENDLKQLSDSLLEGVD